MEIETKRLLLRPLRDDDALAMVHALNNYDVSKYLSRVPFPYTANDAAFFINLTRSYDPRSKVCAITFKCAPDELIGVVSYEDNLEFGYWLRQCCWGMGLMSEAASALVNYAFAEGGLDALNASYWNPISGHILRNLGFDETHQSVLFSKAQNRDVPVTKLRLTREVWLEKQKGRAI
jgi:RimJ/RimL family protein N-acetyltransferase